MQQQMMQASERFVAVVPGTLTLKGIRPHAVAGEQKPAPASTVPTTAKPAAAPAKAAPVQKSSTAPVKPSPAKKPTAPAQKQPPKQPAKKLASELVRVADGAKFVLIFSCPASFVPEGIQTPPAGGGGNGGQSEKGGDEDARRFRQVMLDLDGLMGRCLVDSINVREQQGFCRVYVNCTIGVGTERGFHFWHGAYEKFVRKELGRFWKSAVLKSHLDGRTSLEVKKPYKGDAEAIVRFGIGQ